MVENWEDSIADPVEQKVFKALSDPNWDFRTVSGIATETSVPEATVRKILQKYPQLVRKSAVKDQEGSVLYTLKSKGMVLKEQLAMARSALVS